MRIFTKKSFAFSNGEVDKNGVKKEVVTKPMAFADVPDWVAQDPMFGWAQADGDLEVIASAKTEKTEKTAAKKTGGKNTTPNDPPADPPVNPEAPPEQ